MKRRKEAGKKGVRKSRDDRVTEKGRGREGGVKDGEREESEESETA